MTGHVAPRQATSSPAAITARAPSRTAQRQGKAAIVTCPARLMPAPLGAAPPAPARPGALPPVTEPAGELVRPAAEAAGRTAAPPPGAPAAPRAPPPHDG